MHRFFRSAAQLAKPRLSLAVAFSAATGFFLASGQFGYLLIILVPGVFLLSSGAAALNQYTEQNTDALMARTSNRPIPAGDIKPSSALLVAAVFTAAGALLLLRTGIIPLCLGLLNMVLYNLVYTKLKKATIFSILPGALVGAIPPMIGYAAGGGSPCDPRILAFSTFMFMWQLPHFWLLLVRYGREYEQAGFASVSSYLSARGIKILVFSWIVLSTAFLLLVLKKAAGSHTWLMPLLGSANALFIVLFYSLLFSSDASRVRGAFILINAFSIIVMTGLIILSVLGIV